MERETIKVKVSDDIDITDLPISELMITLNELELKGATHIDVDAEESYGCAILEIEAYYYREENDQEYRSRMQKYENEQEAQRKRELQQLEQLKAKYEKQ